MAKWEGDPDLRSMIEANKRMGVAPFAGLFTIMALVTLALAAVIGILLLFKPMLLPLSPALKAMGMYKTETALIVKAQAPLTCTVSGKTVRDKLVTTDIFALCQQYTGTQVTLTYDPMTGDIDSIKPAS